MSAKTKKNNTLATFWSNFLFVLSIISKISIVVFLMCFAYLIMVYWGDSVRNFQKFTPQDVDYYTKAILNTMKVFEWSVYGIMIFTFIVNYKFDFYSKIMLVASLILAYGIPFVFVKYTSDADFSSIYFLNAIVQLFSRMGKIVLCEAAILCVRDLIIEVKDALRKLKASGKNKAKSIKRSKGKLSLGYHCWDTGYCSKEQRDTCPAFLVRKSCWKLKMGCCDPTLFLLNAKNEYAKKLLKENTLLGMDNQVPWENCKKCHIYFVHQKKKYQILLPLIVLGSLALGYFMYSFLCKIFEKTIVTVDKFTKFLLPNADALDNMQNALSVMAVCMVVVAILLFVSLMVQILHYAIFKLKL